MSTHARFLAGTGGQTLIGGSALADTDWSFKSHGDITEVTNFESNAFYEGVRGIKKGEWSVAGSWDSVNPQETVPGLYPRDDGTPALVMSSQGALPIATMPEWICVDSTVAISVHGVVTFNASGTSQGTFTF